MLVNEQKKLQMFNINNIISDKKRSDRNEEFANQMRDKLNNHEKHNNSDRKEEELNENPELYTAHRNKVSGQTDYETDNQFNSVNVFGQKHSLGKFILLDFKYNHSIFNLVYNKSQVYPFWIRAIILCVSSTLDLLIICLCYTDRVIETRSDYAAKNGYDSIGFVYSFRKEVVHAIIATVISIPIVYCFTLIIKVSSEQKSKLASSLSDIFRYENEL